MCPVNEVALGHINIAVNQPTQYPYLYGLLRYQYTVLTWYHNYWIHSDYWDKYLACVQFQFHLSL